MAYRFDVAFSFAGPHREKVRAIAELVAAKLGRDKVFFDEWYEHEILGSDMDVLLQSFYHCESLMVVADLSEDHADRRWTQAERKAINALRFEIDSARDQTKRLRVLDARFGDGNVPGVFDSTGYLDGITKTAEQCAGVILKRLALLRERVGAATPLLKEDSPPAVEPNKDKPPILFFHPATNDALYSRREHELAWLDACAKDPLIRIVTVTGVGGLGKTSLVGHWIEKARGWQHRAFRGVFFYSFYSNRDPRAFFAEFLDFVSKTQNATLPKDIPLHHLAAAACRNWSYLVVLDGLEVLQHGEEDPHYGWINDGDLTEFVARVGAAGTSLLVLTSRFPFPRITDEHPVASSALEIPLFTNSEGAELLKNCGLDGPHARLEGYSELAGGHPLVLRIFAGACREQPFDEPEKVSRDIRSAQGVETMPDPSAPNLSSEERQKRRQRRQFYKLLLWFQQKLSPPKRRLLQLVALFRDPVSTGRLVALAQGLDCMKADFASCDPVRIMGMLDQLSRQFLLQKDTSPTDDTLRWTSHPIIREVFRESALAAGDTIGKQFAEIVAGKFGAFPTTAAEVLPIVEAIEVLLATGDFTAADALFRGRLDDGWVLLRIPTPQEALRCAHAFLEPVERASALERALGKDSLGRYYIWRGLALSFLGNMVGVENDYAKHNQISVELQKWNYTSNGLRKLALARILEGRLLLGIASANEALYYSAAPRKELAKPGGKEFGEKSFFPFAYPHFRSELQTMQSLAYRAHGLSLAGRLVASSHDFSSAALLLRRCIKHDPKDEPNRSITRFTNPTIWWSRHRFRLGESLAARSLIENNRAVCVALKANDDIAGSDLLLGELALRANNLSQSRDFITAALDAFRQAKMGCSLPGALLAMARLQRGLQLIDQEHTPSQGVTFGIQQTFTAEESALSYCDESLRVAARSGFLPRKCDALNFRALLWRESNLPERARADARDALDIAERCGYYWGRHEALRQLRDAAKALGNRADERHWDEAEQALAARMKPEIEDALRINREHDEEMERLYGGPKPQE